MIEKLTPQEEKAFQDFLDERENKKPVNHIILYNDNINLFEHVVLCLVDYAKHDLLQAEQCALIAHMKGKCEIKSGQYATLKPICEALLENKLIAKIE